jgi:hypothetical protein
VKRVSLFRQGNDAPARVKDFYDQTGIWWGANIDQDDYTDIKSHLTPLPVFTTMYLSRLA